MFKWLSRFLDGRSIKVKVNNAYSNNEDSELGCPQGSVLSPILVCIFMNTLSNQIKQFNNDIPIQQERATLSQFVDDGATWMVSRNAAHVIKRAQLVLDTIEKWSAEWGFTINPAKTQILLVSKPGQERSRARLPALTLCGESARIS